LDLRYVSKFLIKNTETLLFMGG